MDRKNIAPATFEEQKYFCETDFFLITLKYYIIWQTCLHFKCTANKYPLKYVVFSCPVTFFLLELIRFGYLVPSLDLHTAEAGKVGRAARCPVGSPRKPFPCCPLLHVHTQEHHSEQNERAKKPGRTLNLEKKLKCLDTSNLKVEMFSLKDPPRALQFLQGALANTLKALKELPVLFSCVESCQLSHYSSVTLVMRIIGMWCSLQRETETTKL